MKLAFDGQFFLKGDKTGVAWCAENVMMDIGRREDVGKQINFFGMGYSSGQRSNAEKYAAHNYDVCCCKWFHDVVYRMIWNYIPLPYCVFFGKDADVSIFFNFIVPPGVKGKAIAVVHDMAYKAYPETVRKRTRRFLEGSMVKSCKRADHIITVSEFSKRELMKYIPIEEDKISVVSEGVDFDRFHSNYSEGEIEQTKKKYNINGKYILYLGTIEPRKNIKRLIEAYALLRQDKRDHFQLPQLILAGGKGWLCDEIYDSVGSLHLDDCVKFLGYVPDDDVPKLLCGAEMFVFPSLYEGFGLPILEAMACGVPVVAADAASLPEVAQDAAVLVDPMDVQCMKDGMAVLLENEIMRNNLKSAGIEHVKKFAWEKTASRYIEICEELLKKTTE